MIELFEYIRKLNIKIKLLSTDIFAGEYISAFKGKGIEFEEVREYTPGDDIKTIDWNTSARTGKLHTKIFKEERELTVVLIVDISGSMYFGSKWGFKSNLTTEVAALLSYTALRSNDKVSLILFDERIQKFIPPRKGKSHIWQIIREIINTKTTSNSTDLKNVLTFLSKTIKKRSIVFIVSDFLTDNLNFLDSMKILKKRFDFVPIIITDPLEEQFVSKNIFKIRDSESENFYEIKPNINFFHSKFLINKFKKINIKPIHIFTNKPYIPEIIKYFREKRG